jgi:hypothetical protein
MGDTADASPQTTSTMAWRTFCDRLARLGEAIAGDGFPAAPDDRAEGIRHLANQVACWLTYGLGHADPSRPAFFRSSDPVYAWGGPNVDQVARRAAIDGAGAYRVSGRMGACEEWVLQVKAGAAQTGGADVVAEVYASQLGLGPGDDFALVLGGDPVAAGDGPWYPLTPDATFVHVRDYYFDWQPSEPATFVIDRLDETDPARPRPTADSVASLLEDAAAQIEHSLVFWRDYQVRLRDAGERNVFSLPGHAGRGVQDIVYAHAFVALGDDEALVVEVDAAAADLWGIGLYNRCWYEPIDHVGRQASLNHRQVHTEPDGRVHLVLAGEDPGVANWLDTEGRDEVLATLRWMRPPATPEVSARVVPLAEVAAAVPGPRVTPAERRRAVRSRVAHAGWRYRT